MTGHHVFLDLDGTLTDAGPGILNCLRHAAEALGRPLEGDTRRFVGPPLKVAFREILDTDDEAAIERAIALYRERFVPTGMFENSVYPGIPEALTTLRERGRRLVVVTSKPRIYAERILRHFDLHAHFAAVYGPTLDGRPATKSELLARVIEEQHTDPRRACMVGDRSYDIEAGRSNGVKAVGVLWGYGDRPELAAAGVLIESPNDLAAALLERGFG